MGAWNGHDGLGITGFGRLYLKYGALFGVSGKINEMCPILMGVAVTQLF